MEFMLLLMFGKRFGIGYCDVGGGRYGHRVKCDKLKAISMF